MASGSRSSSSDRGTKGLEPVTASDECLRELFDRMRIVENLARYHHSIDAKDWEALASLFTEDATAEYRSLNDVSLFGLEGTYRGRDTIIDWIRAGQEPFQFNGAPTHFMTNHVIEFAEEFATSKSSFNDVDLPTGLTIGTGIYACTHIRVADGWKIERLGLEQRLCDSVIASIVAQRAALDQKST